MLKNNLSHVLIVAAATKVYYCTTPIIRLSIYISIVTTRIYHLLITSNYTILQNFILFNILTSIFTQDLYSKIY